MNNLEADNEILKSKVEYLEKVLSAVVTIDDYQRLQTDQKIEKKELGDERTKFEEILMENLKLRTDINYLKDKEIAFLIQKTAELEGSFKAMKNELGEKGL